MSNLVNDASLVTLIVTFDGTWQQLNLNESLAVDNLRTTKCSWISFTPGVSNAAACFVAGVDRLGVAPTSSNFGNRLPASASGEPSAPLILELGNKTMELEKIYVKGTASETIHVNMLVYP